MKNREVVRNNLASPENEQQHVDRRNGPSRAKATIQFNIIVEPTLNQQSN